MNAQLVKSGNGSFRVFLYGIGHGDNAGRAVSDGHQHGGLTLFFQQNQGLFQVAQLDIRFIKKPAAADANELVVDPAFHTAGSDGSKIPHGGNFQVLFPGTRHDGLPQRVFGTSFH